MKKIIDRFALFEFLLWWGTFVIGITILSVLLYFLLFY